MRNPFLERLIETRMGGIDHGPWPHWENAGAVGDPRAMSQEEIRKMQADQAPMMIQARRDEAYARMQQNFTRALYADDDPAPFSHPARWQRFMNWLGDNRVTNAWLVLIGSEDIDREYR